MDHPERISLVEMLERAAEAAPDKIALWFDDEPVTYQQLVDRSRAVANMLAELGVKPGDTVASLMQNCAEHVYLLFAVAYLGALEVPINTTFRGYFLSHQLRTAKSSIVLADADLAQHVAQVAPDLPDLSRIMVRGDANGLDLPASVEVGRTGDLLGGERRRPKHYEPRWNDPCTIQFTSGTTGPSKGAVLSQNFMINWARQFSAGWFRSPQDTFYAATPLFHMAAKGVGVLGAIYRGASCAVDSRFSVSSFWDRVEKYEAVSTILLGPMLMMLWNLPSRESDRDVPLRAPVAAPIPPDLHRKMEERWNWQFLGFYGLSEAAPLFIGGITEPLEPGTVGKVNSETFDVAIVDDDDYPLPPGAVGEIVCRPRKPHVMFEGYFGNDSATVAVTRNLWFHTGDLGRIDAEGNFSFVDRKKDYLRRRGENISSFEVERAVEQHPAIAEAAAIAVPSELTEDEVKICVVLKPGATLSPEALLEHCVGNMPYFAVPRYIEFLDELPHTPTQKVQKYKLREAGVTPSTWDREVAGYRVTREGLERAASG
ncbi:MAG: AMP-binding protein [Actinomycetota bacterium]